MIAPVSILNQYWGYEQFRPLQEDIIRSVLDGKDTLALMPTGGGKSICYQVPALIKPGMCLVISPLIALMKDQVENLRRKNITAYAIYSGMSRSDVINIFKVVAESNCKFLYVSPERLETSLFKEYLPAFDVNLIAVDEAHCISQWGYDFRPSYLRIAALREELPDVPVLALTASATTSVQQDICVKLAFRQHRVYRQSFERPNLSYSVRQVNSVYAKTIEILKKVDGSAIVYCKSRKRTKEIADLLRLENISADHYHAGLSQDQRNKKQEDWLKGLTRVMVCTNAFGMGIDKPDVRLVIHADAPDSLESYYQEAGRAGRDGKKAFAVLLSDANTVFELEGLSEIRFPTLEEIRTTYQAVMNYLQLPVGAREGVYHEFDLPIFLKKFSLSATTVLYALKTLEQEGWLAFNEQVFAPSKVHFSCGKTHLYNFQGEHPQLEPLISALLRSYEGIFDQETFISEKLLARLTYSDTEKVKQQLAALHHYGLINYQPVKEKPQLLLLRSRIPAADLMLNMNACAKRKEVFEERVQKMIEYLKDEKSCRSKMIAYYFGDIGLKECGICDNCLRNKSGSMNKEEFDSLRHRVLNLVKYENMKTTELLKKLSGIQEEKALQVIEFLQAENKIAVDPAGIISLQ